MSSKKKLVENVANEEANHIELGKFYFLNNKQEEAIVEFEKALELNSENAEAYCHLGLVYETSNNFDLAKQMYMKALAIKNDYPMVRERLNKLIGLEDE